MKKLFASIILTLTVIFCCVGMVGCNNGFQLVKSISITTSGETKSFSSSSEPQISYAYTNAITEEEYNNAPKERRLYYGTETKKASKITVEDAIKAAKNSTRYKVVEEQLKGFWYYSHFDFYGSKKYYYNKSKYEYTYFNFVYVKVKNDTTIVIRKGDTETTYTVTRYNIVKF